MVEVSVAGVHPRPLARAMVERRFGRLLRLLRDGDLFRALGFVRLGDYLSERLGISLRGAQEMMRVEAALERLPCLAAAFEAGEIASGHVRILTRVATAENEAFWVGLARKARVRELARAVSAWARQQVQDDEGLDERVRHDIPAPAWVAGWWRDTIVLVRRLAGSNLPPGDCFEMVVAEAAGVCADPPGALSEDARSQKRVNFLAATDFDAPAPEAGVGDQKQMDRAGDDLHASARVEWKDRSAAIEGSSEAADARAVDRELRRLVTEKQRMDALLADHLRLVALDRSYRQ